MEKCRGCLTKRKNLVSVFEFDNNVSYADMITSLANVKIVKNDEITDKICRMCRNKLIEFYAFKQKIERSDSILRESIGQPMKRLYFNNFSDMKTKIEIDIKPDVIKQEAIDKMFKSGDDYFDIKDTTIKKLNNFNNKENDKNPVTILDFLKTIEDNTNGNSDNFNDFDDNISYSDEEYNLPLSIRLKKNKRMNIKNGEDDFVDETSYSDEEYLPVSMRFKKKRLTYKKNGKVKNKTRVRRSHIKQVPVFLKPVYLEDVCASSRDRKNEKINNSQCRLDICPYCGKTSKTIKSHLLIHTGERKFKCDQCPSAYFNITMLNYHKKKHTNERKYKCDQCVGTFNCISSLRAHKIVHNDEKKFVCEICTKAFKRSGALRRHIMMHNSATTRNVKCELCNMSFYDNVGLRHHMRVHTGERPYKCEICSQPYSYKHDFNRHCFKKHGIFLKRRQVYVMNEEVLKQERQVMNDLKLRAHGIVREGEPENPFTGPQAALAFEQAMKMMKTQPIEEFAAVS